MYFYVYYKSCNISSCKVNPIFFLYNMYFTELGGVRMGGVCVFEKLTAIRREWECEKKLGNTCLILLFLG